MKLAKTIIVSTIACVLVATALAQSPSRKGEGQRGRTIGKDEEMTREAQKLADQFWTGLTKCGTSYFLRAGVRLFEFKDEPHFSFDGEALKPKALSRADVLNSVDPLPVEWEGLTSVSFELCRMNTSVSELPAAYGGGRTFWDGWGKWTNQRCGFETDISRLKGKWQISALDKISCEDLAGWGLIPKPTSTNPSSNDRYGRNNLTDSDSRLESYLVMQLDTSEKDGSPEMNKIANLVMDVMIKRLDLIGILPSKIERIEKTDHILVVKLPPVSDPSRIKTLLTLRARLRVLDLLSVDNHPETLRTYSTKAEAVDALGAASPHDFRVLSYMPHWQANSSDEVKWAIGRLPEIVDAVGWKNCVIASTVANRAATVTCSLNPIGAESLSTWTRSNGGKIFGFVIDDDLIATYPVVSEFGTDLSARIPKAAADNLLILSKSGPLPVRVSIQTQGSMSSYRSMPK